MDTSNPTCPKGTWGAGTISVTTRDLPSPIENRKSVSFVPDFRESQVIVQQRTRRLLAFYRKRDAVEAPDNVLGRNRT